jgi:hypothetical protein
MLLSQCSRAVAGVHPPPRPQALPRWHVSHTAVRSDHLFRATVSRTYLLSRHHVLQYRMLNFPIHDRIKNDLLEKLDVKSNQYFKMRKKEAPRSKE